MPVLDNSANPAADDDAEAESASVVRRNGRFPNEFSWGAASAATSIEGATDQDRRGPSIWDRFADVPGTIADGTSPRRAAGHYERLRADVGLMADLGARSYTFSIAWPRVLPDGKGPINIAGVDFYHRLVDALLEAGIEPRPTLHHWDLPQALEDGGGWTSRKTAAAFERYSSIVVAQLGDRVSRWTTMHDPAHMVTKGHLTGVHAPGRSNLDDALTAAHHLLVAHGRAVHMIREASPNALVGITLGFQPVTPVGDAPFAHLRQRLVDEWENHWFSDPIGGLGYPPFASEQLGWRGEHIGVGDLDLIATPVDFVGVVHRRRQFVGALEGEQPATPSPTAEPDSRSLRLLLRRLYETYEIPEYHVVDTMAAPDDERTADGRIADCDRIDRYERHLDALLQAIDDGVPVAGYAVDLLDGFAWEDGHRSTHGLFEVDPVTMQRTPKTSAGWYADLIADATGQTEPNSATHR